MTIKNTLKLFTIFLLALTLASCSDDSGDDPTSPGDGNGDGDSAPTFQVPEFNGPNTDAMDAQETKVYANAFKSNAQVAASYGAYTLLMEEQDGSWSYTWTENGLSWTITATRHDDGSASWTVKVDGSNDNHSYDNYTIAEGSKNADGSQGSWTKYDEQGNGNVEYSFEWTTNDNGVVNGLMEMPQDNIRFEMVSNPDGSGSIERYEDGVLRFEASWSGQGSGSYTKYDENGDEIGSGSWG